MRHLCLGHREEPDGGCIPHFHLRPTPRNVRLSALCFPTSVSDSLNIEHHVRTAGVTAEELVLGRAGSSWEPRATECPGHVGGDRAPGPPWGTCRSCGVTGIWLRTAWESRAESLPKCDPPSGTFPHRKDVTRLPNGNHPPVSLGEVKVAEAGLSGTWPRIVDTGSAWQLAAPGPHPAQQFTINNLA